VRAVVRFVDMVGAAVAVAAAAMALAAAMVRLHDVSSLFRVPTLE
jgi:dihydropteroate synthase